MIILSLGSNLSSKFGDRFKNLEIAMNYLEGYGILIEKKSSFYETPSYPNTNDPKFINVIISVKTKLPPIDLMSVLIHIEEKLGNDLVNKLENKYNLKATFIKCNLKNINEISTENSFISN